MGAKISKKEKLSIPFLAGLVAFILLVIFLTVGNLVRPRKGFTFSGAVDSLELTAVGIRAISEGPHRSKDPLAVLHVNDLLISGTTLEFISGAKNSAKLRIRPADANHIAYWRFDNAIPLVLTLPTSGRISIFAPTTSSPSTCAPFIDEDIPRKVSLVFVFNTPTKEPLWEIGRPSWNKMQKLNMSIYGFEGGDVNDFMKRGVKQVHGLYFEHRGWPTQICASLAPLLGYSVRIPPEGTQALVDYVPWLGVCCAMKDSPYSVTLPASSIALNGAEGEILLAGKSLGQIGGRLEVDQADGELQVHIMSDGEQLTAKVSGWAGSLVLSGEQIILPWFTEVTNRYPVGIGVLTALISGFLGAIIATRGRVVEAWLGRESDKN